MRKARILLIFGTWVAILPYLGFPYFWKNTLFTLTGLCLMYFSYILYKEFKMTVGGKKQETFDNFSENQNFDANQHKTEREYSDINNVNKHQENLNEENN